MPNITKRLSVFIIFGIVLEAIIVTFFSTVDAGFVRAKFSRPSGVFPNAVKYSVAFLELWMLFYFVPKFLGSIIAFRGKDLKLSRLAGINVVLSIAIAVVLTLLNPIYITAFGYFGVISILFAPYVAALVLKKLKLADWHDLNEEAV